MTAPDRNPALDTLSNQGAATDWLPTGTIRAPAIDSERSTDPLWYKDAVVYQTHIKAFFDSNDDGVGDFAGLLQKLDYIRDLGVTAIWLLPFYPSPLRDDGYDIQDYRSVNPAYGTLADVRRLIKAAHERGLRLITELVINHTSDQHPWFQRARRARAGSKWRDFYVWSDTDQKYDGTRIIFIDTETSNWTWDPVAKAYYWHRFYSHQPDLNFDNPRVVREVLAVLHFWFRMGVDGMRLDAVPYLIEREGTNCENLSETHSVLKRIRAEVDRHYPDRLLLAEANQWPEDTRPYFGDGDECHMAFHFPLMPRMYLSLAREDRHPITDIMRQTPDIPGNCQWAIFLRNHDELTLEMVTEKERDYLWNTYASDRRMRINLGIRRRLAPLMDNDRRRIELMNSMLLSMPGTPVLYYGDEIGMGDNVYLGDRDGVRTPMQWSPDRNGGFSRADPQRTYLPALMGPVYGYQAVNVESQQANPASLLNWMRRLISVRRAYRAFGRGGLRFLYPGNRKVLCYLREFDDQTLLCVVNLSRHAQPVELDLVEFRSRVPIELLSHNPFPPIGELPYLLTLPGHGFYWFLLETEAAAPRWHGSLPEPMPDLITLVTRGGWQPLLDGNQRRDLERTVLPQFVAAQRWFAHKDRRIEELRIERAQDFGPSGEKLLFAGLRLALSGAEDAQYWLPLAVAWDDASVPSAAPLPPFTLARVRKGARMASLVDATATVHFVRLVLQAMRKGAIADEGRLRFCATQAMTELQLPDDAEIRRVNSEQSNTSLFVGNQAILKLYRQARVGVHPEIEVTRFLTERTQFTHTPPLLGSLEWQDDGGDSVAIAAAFRFVGNQGDAWTHLHDALVREIGVLALAPDTTEVPGAAPAQQPFAAHLGFARLLGQRTGELHHALASVADDQAFAPEPIQADDLVRWHRTAATRAARAFDSIMRLHADLKEQGDDDESAAPLEQLLARRGEIEQRLAAVTEKDPTVARTRIHGDYHLGQVLVVGEDCMILDFEGEPSRPLAERREKGSPIQDVAGMLRSFDYLMHSAGQRLIKEHPGIGERARELLREWHERSVRAFFTAWRRAAEGSAGMPADAAVGAALLEFFLLDKSLYEISYEAANRPKWIGIPVGGLNRLLSDPDRIRQLWNAQNE